MAVPRVPTTASILARDGKGQPASAAPIKPSRCPACDLGECWNANVYTRAAAGHLVDLAEFQLGTCELNLESLDFVEPAFTLGFGDAGDQVVTDFDEPGAACRIGAEQRAAQAGMFVDAGGPVDAAGPSDTTAPTAPAVSSNSPPFIT